MTDRRKYASKVKVGDKWYSPAIFNAFEDAEAEINRPKLEDFKCRKCPKEQGDYVIVDYCVATSPLPYFPYLRVFGAGEGNRTLATSLEG